ncbi:MAG: hypothetical protein LBD16_09420 [Oscillospiraceae bacterium]|jgi:hypothetical protein|nr:hypothetical protein [Oscillospiraceae bacterium]
MKRFIGIALLSLVLIAAVITVTAIGSNGGSAEYERYLGNPVTPAIGNSYVDPNRAGYAAAVVTETAPAAATPAVTSFDADPYGSYKPNVASATVEPAAQPSAPQYETVPTTSTGGFGDLSALSTTEVETCVEE